MFDELGEDFECVGGVAASPSSNLLRAKFGVFLWEVGDGEDSVNVYCTDADDVIVFDVLR